MSYNLHNLKIPDLRAEIEQAWDLGQYDAEKRADELGITVAVINYLYMGAKLVVPIDDRRFRPAKDNGDDDHAEIWACLVFAQKKLSVVYPKEHLGSTKSDPYLGVINASGNEVNNVGKLRVRSFQRIFHRLQRRQ